MCVCNCVLYHCQTRSSVSDDTELFTIQQGDSSKDRTIIKVVTLVPPSFLSPSYLEGKCIQLDTFNFFSFKICLSVTMLYATWRRFNSGENVKFLLLLKAFPNPSFHFLGLRKIVGFVLNFFYVHFIKSLPLPCTI